MNNQEQKKSISEAVLDKIKSGGVRIKPKLYFVLKTILVVLGGLAIGLFVLFLISFISFALRASGVWFLPEFGLRGFGMFFSYLPWLLILMAALLIIGLETLLKRFTFIYRKPVIYSLLAVILIAFLGGFLIDRTPFHSGLFLRAREGNLPLAGPMYRDFGILEPNEVHRGVVLETTENGFIIEMPQGEVLNVVISPDVHLAPEFEIKKDDAVVVFGEEHDGTVNALYVRKIDDNFRFSPRSRPSFPPLNRMSK